MRVDLVPHKEEWAKEFAEIGGRLRAVLGGAALSIHHIGSTAVPGLAAKDVIDVQVTVASLDDVIAHGEDLLSVGLVLRDALGDDHSQRRRPSTPEDWVKRYIREAPGARRTHIHVRELHRLNRRYALLFRDYLRAHPREAQRYLAEKRRLAVVHNFDSLPYSLAKGDICDDLIEGAEDWAAASGWTLSESDA